MKANQLVNCILDLAPAALAESYDNVGLLVGESSTELTGALVTLDITEQVIDEAIELGVNAIISHHPIIFSGLKKINGNNSNERCVLKAIRHNIVLIAAHTNLDNSSQGVNFKIAQKLGLKNTEILAPLQGKLNKIVTFVPTAQADRVRKALWNAGAGTIGNYDCCSYNTNGSGTFRAGTEANPFVGKLDELHTEPEVRVEVIAPKYHTAKIIKALLEVHPYEEPAFDVYALENSNNQVGAGMLGTLDTPLDENEFLKLLQTTFKANGIRHSNLLGKKIERVALCGGSGSFLIQQAISSGAQCFVTADIKYHQFQEADEKIVLADIGHFESEQFTKELIMEIVQKKNPNFAIQISRINTNPINYF